MGMIKKYIRIICLLILCSIVLNGCIPKAYSKKEEKEKINQAVKLAQEYFKDTSSSARVKKSTFHIETAMKDDDYKMYITDWVGGDYLDGGSEHILVNTETREIYTSKHWNILSDYGSKRIEEHYGLGKPDIRVEIYGHKELPYCIDDNSFGNIEINNKFPAKAVLDKEYVNSIFDGTEYNITYKVIADEKVNIDVFKDKKYDALGENVDVMVLKYPSELFDEYFTKGSGIDNRQAIEVFDSTATAEPIKTPEHGF